MKNLLSPFLVITLLASAGHGAEIRSRYRYTGSRSSSRQGFSGHLTAARFSAPRSFAARGSGSRGFSSRLTAPGQPGGATPNPNTPGPAPQTPAINPAAQYGALVLPRATKVGPESPQRYNLVDGGSGMISADAARLQPLSNFPNVSLGRPDRAAGNASGGNGITTIPSGGN